MHKEDSLSEHIIATTRKWIIEVVIGCNFCPFAAKEIKRGSIHYEVLHNSDSNEVLAAVLKIMQQLDADAGIETTLLILPGSFGIFDDYLNLLYHAEALHIKEDYEGIYQIAGFHPEYLFAGSTHDDPANYTNRSPYPMLHFLREDSVSNAVDNYPGIEDIPNRNIAFAQKKGLPYMKQFLLP